MSSTPPPPPTQPPAGSGGPPASYQPPGSYPPPQPYAQQPYPQQYGYVPAAVVPFKRNPMLVLAQVLAIIQGSLGVIIGLLFIVGGIAFNSAIQTALNQSNVDTSAFAGAVTGIFIGVGVFLLVIFTLIIFLAVRTGHPSQVARWFLAVIEILFLLNSLRGIGAGGNGSLYSIGFIVFLALIVFGLVIDPGTYRAFARRNLP